jgi:hypothetical protein
VFHLENCHPNLFLWVFHSLFIYRNVWIRSWPTNIRVKSQLFNTICYIFFTRIMVILHIIILYSNVLCNNHGGGVTFVWSIYIYLLTLVDMVYKFHFQLLPPNISGYGLQISFPTFSSVFIFLLQILFFESLEHDIHERSWVAPVKEILVQHHLK